MSRSTRSSSVDVAAGRPVRAGHGGRHDRQPAAARVAERRADRPAAGIARSRSGAGALEVRRAGAARRRAPGRTGRPARRRGRRRPSRRRRPPSRAAGDDVGVGHDVPVGHDDATARCAARRRRRRGSGPCCRRPARRWLRAVASLGRSTGGRGSGSKPTNTSGRPESSSRLPSPVAISVGGGRTALSVRIAVDVWAASVRRGTGPIASRPPASHTMRRAWAAPVMLPASRSAAPRNPVPSDRAAVRPMAEPTDSPMPDRHQQAGQHDVRADADRDRCRAARPGRARPRIASAPPPTAPSRPPTCGQRSGVEAEDDGEDDQQDGDEVERVHRADRRTGRSWSRAVARCVRGIAGRSDRRRARADGQPTVTSTGGATAARVA